MSGPFRGATRFRASRIDHCRCGTPLINRPFNRRRQNPTARPPDSRRRDAGAGGEEGIRSQGLLFRASSGRRARKAAPVRSSRIARVRQSRHKRLGALARTEKATGGRLEAAEINQRGASASTFAFAGRAGASGGLRARRNGSGVRAKQGLIAGALTRAPFVFGFVEAPRGKRSGRPPRRAVICSPRRKAK